MHLDRSPDVVKTSVRDMVYVRYLNELWGLIQSV